MALNPRTIDISRRVSDLELAGLTFPAAMSAIAESLDIGEACIADCLTACELEKVEADDWSSLMQESSLQMIDAALGDN